MAEKKEIKTKKHTKVKKRINASKRSIQKNNDRVKELELQLNELQDKQLRLKAEFENFRKRKQREISELFQYDGERVIKEILPLIDDLERMAKAAEDQNDKTEASLLEGVQMVESKIKKFLELHEIIPIRNLGFPLPPQMVLSHVTLKTFLSWTQPFVHL